MKCICNKTHYGMERPELEPVYMHVNWCPQSPQRRKYDKLHWIRKMFTKNPSNY